jgi:hypothetical protein
MQMDVNNLSYLYVYCNDCKDFNFLMVVNLNPIVSFGVVSSCNHCDSLNKLKRTSIFFDNKYNLIEHSALITKN